MNILLAGWIAGWNGRGGLFQLMEVRFLYNHSWFVKGGSTRLLTVKLLQGTFSQQYRTMLSTTNSGRYLTIGCPDAQHGVPAEMGEVLACQG